MSNKPEYGKLVLISTADICPHPDNPRKELGDLSELAESIRINGILQNLTVVPVFGNLSNEFCGKYTAVIGHRRLAAAKIAGVASVPCIVSDMTHVQQIRTMLSENMQRADLTMYEQAQGIQMMMDLGDSVKDIVERTGLSITTVRRRVKLLELDKDKFQKAEKRGATLMDYIKLEDIESIETRNKVLDSIGTNNFQRELQNAMGNQKRQKRKNELLEVIRSFATEDPDATYSTRQYVGSYSRWSSNLSIDAPADVDTVKYYYKDSGDSVYLYRDIDHAAEDAEQAKRAEESRKQRETHALYMDISKEHFDLRAEFVKGVSNTACKKAMPKISSLLIDVAYEQRDFEIDVLGRVLGIEINADNEDQYFSLSEVLEIANAAKATPEKLMLCLAFCAADDEESGYWNWEWNNGSRVYLHKENILLDKVYELLICLGYDMSDDEKNMQNGCHDLFACECDSEPEVE